MYFIKLWEAKVSHLFFWINKNVTALLLSLYEKKHTFLSKFNKEYVCQ